MGKQHLQTVLVEALKYYGGSATIVEVCKYVWDNYESSLRESGNLFFTWQYDIRWAATQLRKAGIMCPNDLVESGIWKLNASL